MLAKFLALLALFLVAVMAQDSAILNSEEEAKGKKPCQRQLPCRHERSSSSLCPRQRRCGCPSSEACPQVYCPRRKPASSTSSLPSASSDNSSVIECPCCISSSDDPCGFLLAGNDPAFIDRRCECNPCACNPCAGRKTDPCDCN